MTIALRQSAAMIVDAYRELNARRLFWITLLLSGLAVVTAAMVGINEKGLVLIVWELPVPFANTNVIPREVFYTQMLFKTLGINLWLAWIASILALISTAGIFPDFITGGSIDLMLCRPIGRLRLFLTRYATGLLFVALQVGVFCVASFLVIGLRGGVWEPAIFLAVPLVVCFFSYLFGFCVLLGVWTRSTIAALLLTLLIWFGLWVLNSTDGTIVMFQSMQQETVAEHKRRVAALERQLQTDDDQKQGDGFWSVFIEALPRLEQTPPFDQQRQALAQARDTLHTIDTIARISYTVRTFLPKTDETINLLDRTLPEFVIHDNDKDETSWQTQDTQHSEHVEVSDEAVAERIKQNRRSRSVGWVIGTSLAFEAVVVGFAAWLFCRRDY